MVLITEKYTGVVMMREIKGRFGLDEMLLKPKKRSQVAGKSKWRLNRIAGTTVLAMFRKRLCTELSHLLRAY